MFHFTLQNKIIQFSFQIYIKYNRKIVFPNKKDYMECKDNISMVKASKEKK